MGTGRAVMPMTVSREGQAPQDRSATRGHALTYPNVIVAHWPKPGSGKLVRAWHCLTCKATIYDD